MESILPFSSDGFSSKPKTQGNNLNISRTKRAFIMKWTTSFIIFKGFSVVRNCLRPEGGPLKWKIMLSYFCLNFALPGSGYIFRVSFPTFVIWVIKKKKNKFVTITNSKPWITTWFFKYILWRSPRCLEHTLWGMFRYVRYDLRHEEWLNPITTNASTI